MSSGRMFLKSLFGYSVLLALFAILIWLVFCMIGVFDIQTVIFLVFVVAFWLGLIFWMELGE